MTGILDQIRTAAARVADRARFVSIRHDRLESYAEELRYDLLRDEPAARAADTESVAGRVLAAASVNFGSGWHPLLRKRPGMSGSVTIGAGLSDYLDATGPITTERLRRFTPADCSQVFGQELDAGAVEELMALFAAALVQLGEHVDRHADGSFAGFVGRAEGSADALVEQLSGLPMFHDIAHYDGGPVPLLKRAQLATWDLHREVVELAGIEGLTIFADNLVPHVLRIDGLLEFDPALRRAIEAGELLEWGSPAEVELRAVAVHTAEVLRATSAAAGALLISAQLDQVLWSRAARRYKTAPRPRCRCIHY